LNLTSEVVRASPAARRRYLILRGSLVPLPGSPAVAVGTPLLSAAGKLRALAEPLIATGSQDDESVVGFLGRRFGQEAAKRFGVPLVSGLVAGDPQRLSVGSLFPGLVALERRYGSVLRGLIAQQRAARR